MEKRKTLSVYNVFTLYLLGVLLNSLHGESIMNVLRQQGAMAYTHTHT